MAKNDNLQSAKANKNDEFYTELSDIENELRHYKAHFKGKVVLCNCDDPYESNFVKYFALNFNVLGIKKLIATCYGKSKIAHTQISFFDNETVEGETKDKIAYVMEITGVNDENGDGAIDLTDFTEMLKKHPPKKLIGDGDFRSEECIEYLKQADIVVTNPPFSLFREYVATLMKYEKNFIIIGSQNAITYKEFFPLLKDNKVWLGNNSVKKFMQPNGDYKQFGNISWYTNLDIPKKHDEADPYKTYTPEEYPTYDNYKAIEVSKVSDIPKDYNGVMGVPITFLNKYNPEQFEILGADEAEGTGFSNGLFIEGSTYKQCYANGKRIYKRIFIRYTNKWVEAHPKDFKT